MAEKKEKEEVSISEKLAKKVAEKADRLRSVIIGLAVAAVVVIVAVAAIRYMNDAKRAASENALYLGQIEAFGSTNADPAAALDKVATEYPGLPAGAQATLLKFFHFNGADEPEKAEAVALDFLKAYPNDAFAPKVRLGLGQLFLNSGRFEEARRELQPLAREADPAVPEAVLALARIAELEAVAAKGDPAQYDIKLNEVRDAYTNIVSASQSRQSYWPPQVAQVADFALLLANDRLSGYEHPAPHAAGAVGGDADAGQLDVGILAAPPPPADDAGDAAPAAPGGEPAASPAQE